MNHLPQLTPSDFIAVCNQVLDLSFPIVELVGEVSNYRVSKGKWIYFDIKDEFASVKCFATTFNLNMPIADGMKVLVSAKPQIHPLYNFSLTVTSISPQGEGSIKKSVDLLKAKLEGEGLFADERKRPLPYPPKKVGLITSDESAAYGDFIKVLSSRWTPLKVILRNTKVQGQNTVEEIVEAIEMFNKTMNVEVLVIIRGGGSADDLLPFQDERLARSIAGSRIPTLVAIGHERDISIAELVADLRASTPSNAAELLTPAKLDVVGIYKEKLQAIAASITGSIDYEKSNSQKMVIGLLEKINNVISNELSYIKSTKLLLNNLNPESILKQGYAIVRDSKGNVQSDSKKLKIGDEINIKFRDGETRASVIG